MQRRAAAASCRHRLPCRLLLLRQRLDTKQVTKIEKGKTTEAEVVKMLGEPNQRIVSASGGTMLQWHFHETNSIKHMFDLTLASRSTSTNKMLMVTLDKAGIVQDYTLSEGSTLNQSYR